jgi:hypothetical protein
MMQSSSLLVASLLWLSGVAGFAPPLVRTTLLGRAPFQAGSSSSSYQAEVAGRGASPALDVKDDLEAAISDGVDKGYWVRSRETGNNIKQVRQASASLLPGVEVTETFLMIIVLTLLAGGGA